MSISHSPQKKPAPTWDWIERRKSSEGGGSVDAGCAREKDESCEDKMERMLRQGQALRAEFSPLPEEFWGESLPVLVPSQPEPESEPAEQSHHRETWGRLRAWWLERQRHWALGAVAVMGVCVGVFWFGGGGARPCDVAEKPCLQAKSGAVSFRLLVRRGAQTNPVDDTWKARNGDQLRFVYRLSASKVPHYLLLWMVDRRGKVSPLYPEEPNRPFVLPSGSARYLPDGAELEGLTGPERIYACVSLQPIKWKDVKRALRSSLRRASISQLPHLPLSCLYQQSWLASSSTSEQGHE